MANVSLRKLAVSDQSESQATTIRTLTEILMEHYVIGNFADNVSLPHQDYCRSCQDVVETESVQKLLRKYPAIQNKRNRFLVDWKFEALSMVANVSLRELVGFVQTSE